MSWLDASDIPYKETDVFENDDALEFMQENGYSSLPLTFVEGKIINGVDPVGLDAALSEAGYKLNI